MLQRSALNALEAGDRDLSGTPPLVVDLDGTLLRTDLLYESFALLMRQRPWLLLLIPLWLLRGGKARLKREIAERVDLDVGTLPLNRPFLDWVLRQRMEGRTVVIASAADQSLVDRVAADLGFFHDAIGSDGVTDLSGRRKIDADPDPEDASGLSARCPA